ncbi:MAG: HPr family phosphocarrier protein, partial [Oscillospiraceae bacterium]|nr:HPr family phosphocarrier protein [Oscillospiraceae bacterium]
MKTARFEIKTEVGIHARPAAMIAQICVALPSQITFRCGERTASGSNLIQLLRLGAKKGSVLDITVDGGDEEASLEKILEILSARFSDKKHEPRFRIAFFGTKDYDRIFFSELIKDTGEGSFNCDIDFFSVRLTSETVYLAQGHDAVCIFV